MNKTKIEYLDYTWNPLVGCMGIDCSVRKNCWARKSAKRRGERCVYCVRFEPHWHPDRLEEPLKVKKPARIGVCFMGDLFDRSAIDSCEAGCIDYRYWKRLWDVMQEASWHTFVLLTKHPENIPSWKMPDNVWLGVSVNKHNELERIDTLREKDAKLMFVSFEPLYEDLSDANLEGINWVIIGAQTRPDLQPKSEWVETLAIQANDRHIPVFLKNNLRGFEKVQEYP